MSECFRVPSIFVSFNGIFACCAFNAENSNLFNFFTWAFYLNVLLNRLNVEKQKRVAHKKCKWTKRIQKFEHVEIEATRVLVNYFIKNANKFIRHKPRVVINGSYLTRRWCTAPTTIFIYAKHYNNTFIKNFHFPAEIPRCDNKLWATFFSRCDILDNNALWINLSAQ